MFTKKTHDTETGARALGIASIGIGLTELAAPQYVEDMLGIEDRQIHRGILRVLGVRELLHGVGLLTAKRGNGQLSTGVWARVAGDMLDRPCSESPPPRPGGLAALHRLPPRSPASALLIYTTR
jgi:hypothetical protein